MSGLFSRERDSAFDDGRVIELHAGDLFYVPPVPHDSWVIGDEPYVSLHFSAPRSTRLKAEADTDLTA
jgi:hypothetical protein